MINIEKFITKRIKENTTVFSEAEKVVIYKNVELVQKIYLLGLLDASQKWLCFISG